MRPAAALAAAMAITIQAPRETNSMWLDRDDYPAGYRAQKRSKPRDEKKAAKRKAQKRARRITRNFSK